MMTLYKAKAKVIIVAKVAYRLGYIDPLLEISRFEITIKGSGKHFNVSRNIKYLSWYKL